VLGKKTGPLPRVSADVGHAGAADIPVHVDAVGRNDTLHCGLAAADDRGMPYVERDPQAVYASGMPRDVSIAEVEAEEIDVLRREAVEIVLRVATASTAGSSTRDLYCSGHPPMAPVDDRRPWDSCPPAYLAVVQT
jgi:hypothetical protein